MRRRGPRPLLLHLTLAWMKSSSSTGAWPSSNSAWPPSGPDLPSKSLPSPVALLGQLEAAARTDHALIAGIAAYRASPYERVVPAAKLIWQEGESTLADYGGAGPAVLFIPSLVNRGYIFDLMEGSSMLRWLAGAGAHPYLLEWGWPGAVERSFDLTDYIAGRLERAIAAIPGPIVLAGYCMGGLLALAAALRLGDKIAALALLATPWDFHQPDAQAAARVADMLGLFAPAMHATGTLPIDALNTMFALADPFGVGDKYRNFAAQDKASPRAQRFVAVEDWLADGVPLAAPVARECLAGWYGANSPARLAWRVAGQVVDPAALRVPQFVAIPARDRLVPAASAAALAARLPAPHIVTAAAGHIGMVAGTHAQTALWEPFAEWLRGLAS
jgi:polyhydroxyalkanoate synthase